MPLIAWRDRGHHSISDRANACPECSYPIANQSHMVGNLLSSPLRTVVRFARSRYGRRSQSREGSRENIVECWGVPRG